MDPTTWLIVLGIIVFIFCKWCGMKIMHAFVAMVLGMTIGGTVASVVSDTKQKVGTQLTNIVNDIAR